MATTVSEWKSEQLGEVMPDSMIPALLAARPHLRSVFDRYGLRGCGGRYGPAETVAYFARVHGVEVDRLLEQLRATHNDEEGSGPLEERIADEMVDFLLLQHAVLVLVHAAEPSDEDDGAASGEGATGFPKSLGLVREQRQPQRTRTGLLGGGDEEFPPKCAGWDAPRVQRLAFR